MILATTKFADWDRFWSVFSTGGRREARRARLQGRARVPRRRRPDSVWVVFDWDDAGWQSFVSDPDGPAGHEGRRATSIKPYTLALPRRDRGLRGSP